MNKDNKNTEVNNTDKKLHISDVSDSCLSRFKLGIKKYGFEHTIDSDVPKEYVRIYDENSKKFFNEMPFDVFIVKLDRSLLSLSEDKFAIKEFWL